MGNLTTEFKKFFMILLDDNIENVVTDVSEIENWENLTIQNEADREQVEKTNRIDSEVHEAVKSKSGSEKKQSSGDNIEIVKINDNLVRSTRKKYSKLENESENELGK